MNPFLLLYLLTRNDRRQRHSPVGTLCLFVFLFFCLSCCCGGLFKP